MPILNYPIGFMLIVVGVIGFLSAIKDLEKYKGIYLEPRPARVLRGGSMWFYLFFLACLVVGGVGLLVPGGGIGQ